jgi:endonuclease-8
VPDLPGLIDLSRRTILANRDRSERTFTGDLRKGRMRYVYGRMRKPCLRCGTPILRADLGDPVRPGQGSQDRVVYWCPRCQS